MSLAKDLLSQASWLAKHEPRRPRQASLRRAVSTAYYALFHLLTDDASRLLLSGSTLAPFRPILKRTFQHGEMKDAARGFADGQLAKLIGSVVTGVSRQVADVASVFVDLQEARHEADYDLRRSFTRREVLDLIDQATDAFGKWSGTRGRHDANALLVALAMHNRLKR